MGQNFGWQMGSVILFCLLSGWIQAQGISGTVEWSDGKKVSGDISLSPGKQLCLTVDNALPSTFRLEDVREIRLTVEKEEMYEGWFFPEAGKTIKEKTGEIYPIRYLETKITLKDGQTFRGHLYTTVLYVEAEPSNQKVVLLAKQTGVDKQPLSALVYPTLVSFDSAMTAASSVQINLSKAGLNGIKRLLVVSKPGLQTLVARETAPGSQIWSVPWGDPAKLIFMVECHDGLHVSWPAESNPDWVSAVDKAFTVMQEFYDRRTVLGCFLEPGSEDLYSLVLMQRIKGSVDGGGTSLPSEQKPWDVAILRWKYEAETKQTTLLGRTQLLMGRSNGQIGLPLVIKDPTLLEAISVPTLAVPSQP